MKTRAILRLALAIILTARVPLYAQSAKTPRKPSTAEQQAPSPLQQAEVLIEKKDFPSAEKLLTDATNSNPRNYQAWFYLGYVYNATQRKPQAIEAYRKAVALSPGLLESNLNLAILLLGEGNPEAAKYLRAAGQAKPTPEATKTIAAAWMKLAESLEKTDPAGAIDAYREGVALRPSDPAPHVELGRMLEARQDLPAAEKEYKQALAIDAHSSDALAQLSNIYMRSKRLPEAETMLRNYVRLNPANVAAHVQLGRVLQAQNKNDEAVAELKAALTLAPGDADALREIAAMQLGAKQYPAAEASYRKLLNTNPKDAEFHRGLATSLLHQLKYSQAKAELLETVKFKPDWGEAYGDLALAAENDKDYNLALKALDARAHFLPDTPNSVWIRATVFDHLGAVKEASAKYKQFLSMAGGQYPDKEWQARHRLIAIDPGSRK